MATSPERKRRDKFGSGPCPPTSTVCFWVTNIMAKEKNNKSGGLTFEQAIDQLNQIVSRIEQGQVPLQESLEQYEKGMTLIQHCRGILQDAEKRIEQISAKNESASAESEAEEPDEENPH
jgi:exodeoxyribonuclease VII small subunit